MVPPEQRWAQVGSLAASKGSSSSKCRQRAQHLLRQLRPRPGLADFASSLQEFYQLQLATMAQLPPARRTSALAGPGLASVARGKFNYEIQQLLGPFLCPFFGLGIYISTPPPSSKSLLKWHIFSTLPEQLARVHFVKHKLTGPR